jgi:hypothetical protein
MSQKVDSPPSPLKNFNRMRYLLYQLVTGVDIDYQHSVFLFDMTRENMNTLFF